MEQLNNLLLIHNLVSSKNFPQDTIFSKYTAFYKSTNIEMFKNDLTYDEYSNIKKLILFNANDNNTATVSFRKIYDISNKILNSRLSIK